MSAPRRSPDGTRDRGPPSSKDRDDVRASATLQSSPPSDSSDPGGGIIDMETFQQIVDLDEDDTHDFSAGMAWAYLVQARSTFEEMDGALAATDLSKLNSLGHFLKGSSAALGVSKVQASCERIQHYGAKRDEEAARDLTADEALSKISSLLSQVKKEYADAETWLKDWYRKQGVPVPEDG